MIVQLPARVGEAEDPYQVYLSEETMTIVSLEDDVLKIKHEPQDLPLKHEKTSIRDMGGEGMNDEPGKSIDDLVGVTTSQLSSKRPEEDHGHARHATTERTVDCNGHHVVIRTTYEVLVDGEPLGGHLGVLEDGRVHYHGLPNYVTGSAVDLVCKVVETFAGDFEQGEPDEAGDH